MSDLDDRFVRGCLDLPERIAEALGIVVVAAIDEFQELAGHMPGQPLEKGR